MEEEDLAKRWERLNLSSTESEVLKIPSARSEKNFLRRKHCIVGSVMSDKGINHEAFRSTMSQVWRLEGWVKFKDLGEHKFLIEFQLLVDKEKVLGGRPWFFDRNLVAFLEMDEDDSLNATRFQFEPFWVQLHSLPWGAMTEEVGIHLGSSVGHVIRVDADSDGVAWGKCMRVRVAVDLHKPLLRGKWMELNNRKHWISVKYERLQAFCFQCGIIAHKGKNCTLQRDHSQSPEAKPLQFGPWLRAQPLNSKIFEARQYGGTFGGRNQQQRQQSEEVRGRDKEASSEKDIRIEEALASVEVLQNPSYQVLVNNAKRGNQYKEDAILSISGNSSKTDSLIAPMNEDKSSLIVEVPNSIGVMTRQRGATWKRKAREVFPSNPMDTDLNSKGNRKRSLTGQSELPLKNKKAKGRKDPDVNNDSINQVEAARQPHQQK
ncbi:uncharacterized protein LOC122278532 [Carya illinoinensis]|uniref:uncharacterized protein LOC122278532 n=1 Tax=Carya illinoinensis TaxID=32201 RepID=UPI001C721EDC|nr:uncharacterized protein LOC122278532 [Carya illinoinensis]